MLITLYEVAKKNEQRFVYTQYVRFCEYLFIVAAHFQRGRFTLNAQSNNAIEFKQKNLLWLGHIVLLKALFIFSIPVAATVDLMVSRIGPKLSTSNSNGAIGFKNA